MDHKRFDALTRRLAAGASRRATLRTVAAGALAAGLTQLGLVDVAARCKKPGQKCDKRKECCKGTHCKRGKCACGRGQAKCGKECCANHEKCFTGAGRRPTCCPGLKICGKTCCPPDKICLCIDSPLDPPLDPDDLCRCVCADGYDEDENGKCICPHPCGDDCCDTEDGEECCIAAGEPVCRCPSGTTCVDGTCSCWDDGGDWCNGACCTKEGECCAGSFCCQEMYKQRCCGVDCAFINSDVDNCGMCGRQCKRGETCVEGECVPWPGTCPKDMDFCASDGDFFCGPDGYCFCFTALDGSPRCGQWLGACTSCADDADCSEHGPEAFCAEGGTHLCCGEDEPAFCAGPCRAQGREEQ